MTEKRRSVSLSVRCRRSSLGASLLPSQDSFKGRIAEGIPEHERLAILLRMCYKGALGKLSDECDISDQLRRALTIEGSLKLQDIDDDDILHQLARAATDPLAGLENESGAVKCHSEIRKLALECKQWDNLLESNFNIAPFCQDDSCSVSTSHTECKMILEHASRFHLEACLHVQEVTGQFNGYVLPLRNYLDNDPSRVRTSDSTFFRDA